MKRYLFALIMLIFFIGSCSDQKNSKDKMRRFVFVSLDANKYIDISEVIKDKKAYDLLLENGFVNVETYNSDSINIIIVDAEADFDLDTCKKVINNLSKESAEFLPFAKVIDGEYALIDRIYKMEQKRVYTAAQGQLIRRTPKEYARFVLTLEIINDPELANEYVAVHAPGKAWPEITQNMKTVGIKDMEIYLTGYRAFLIMDTKPDFDWDTDGEKWGTLPREKEWQAYVAKFQKTNPESKAAEKWKSMK
ncbi:L-rhamnose mutarotase [uncultured Draconibacterium sp.]|uniref:L-rhamnose mutarotase n=1 Tax=uncultured Draconibacterium sp. TaxID=1573823 RepID=UPI0032612BB8